MPKLEKHLLYYFKGKGIDTSREPFLKDSLEAKVAYLFKEPNNLYHFYENEGIKYESFDFVFNYKLLTETKFFKILFKEWFYLLRIGGNLVMQFEGGQGLNSANIDEVLGNLMGNSGEILYVKKSKNNFFTVIVQKLKSALAESDGIDKWSFCVVNQNNRHLEEFMESIESQNIPHYEILLESPVDFLEDNEHIRVVYLLDDQGKLSTSMKKNQMLLSAKYENVAIIDNKKCDLTLDENWYKEVKRYGNYFESLSCVLVTADGERYADWWTLGCEKGNVSEKLFKTSRLGLLEYIDWDDWTYFSDSICILKKDLYQKARWDEYSENGEGNIQFCHQLLIKGAIMRLSPNLISRVENESFEQLASNFPRFMFDKDKLGKRKGKLFRRGVWVIAEMLLKIREFPRMRERVIKILKFIRLYNLIARK